VTYARAKACERCAHNLAKLEAWLEAGTPRRYLHPLVELLEMTLGQTGPETLETMSYRARLAACKARLVTKKPRTTLRLVK
jgi:hypothetical protein